MTKPVPASRCFLVALPLLSLACDPGTDNPAPATGGTRATGGTTGGGGSANGGSGPKGGAVSTGGVAGGGGTVGSGGMATGGSAAPGGAGSSSGGSPSGGTPASGGASGSNSTGGAAGAVGGGGAGGGSAGTPASDPCTEALFCDDFEKATTGQAPGGDWTPRTSSGAVSVDESKHVSGTKSVKFTTEAKDGTKTAFLRLKSDSVFPVTGNHLFGRMMTWLDAAPTESVHWTLMQATGTIPGQNYRAQYRYGGQHPIMEGGMFKGSQWMANYETPDSYSGTGPSTDCYHHGNKTVIPTGKWACVEWEFDGPNTTLRMWLDGEALDDLTVVGKGQGCVSQDASYTWTAPDFSELEIGWESYQNDAARTLYIDDVVVSTKRIGCPTN